MLKGTPKPTRISWETFCCNFLGVKGLFSIFWPDYVPRGVKRQRTCGAWKQSTQKPTINQQSKYLLNLTALNNII